MSVRKFSTASILSPSYKNSKIWDGETFPGYFESIQTVVVPSGGSATVEFNNIPQNYTHLQIRASARSTYAGSGDGYKLNFNGVSGTSYSYHLLIGSGSSVTAATNTSAGFMITGDLPASTETANIFGSSYIDILDYTNTNKYKTIKALTGDNRNGSGSIRFTSGLFMSTNAITSISFSSFNAGNYAQYSQFALYGIRSA